MRQVLMWFGVSDPRLFRRDVFPIFITESPHGEVYGLPAIDGNGLKVARHYGAAELAGPSAIDRTVSDADEMKLDVQSTKTVRARPVPFQTGSASPGKPRQG